MLRTEEQRRQSAAADRQHLLQEKSAETKKKWKERLMEGNSLQKEALLCSHRGITNVTKFSLESKVADIPIVTVTGKLPRGNTTSPLAHFNSLVSTPFKEWLVGQLNTRQYAQTPFTIAELDAIFRMHTERINAPPVRTRNYLCSTNRLGYYEEQGKIRFVGPNRYATFLKHLRFDPGICFEYFNQAFFEALHTFPTNDGWTFFAGDESMAAWRSQYHKWTVFIQRKPQPNADSSSSMSMSSSSDS